MRLSIFSHPPHGRSNGGDLAEWPSEEPCLPLLSAELVPGASDMVNEKGTLQPINGLFLET